ncbi:outer membrane protein transport protein [Thiomicrorhabdus sp. ZW0627]|uniref:OmpP1/FadL family transporter n=1 Tax=Thiomicrorhabdus sp. ZW0627 TaxID=3039774 RepID=UPI0024373086|nr:outer membrane protein transport protein [Thiomicrorhabdus sp. ZW0627]MDG6774888.1 outer membrane protein transport protein [Thiomicrorhabdus sp. ZW0627]
MKKTKLALAVSTAIFASSAMATNGTNMTGVGAQSSAMGGTGVAAYYGAENVIVNPGLIGKSQGTEFSFGGTLFKPSVSNNGLLDADGQSQVDSDADTFVIPSVSLTSRINDNLTFGIGMYGTSGMGVDYSKNDVNFSSNVMNQFEAKSNLQIMRFVPTLAYNEANFGIGISPVIQYGALDINYKTVLRDNSGNPVMVNGAPYAQTIGNGVSSDLGFGFSLGGYFDINKDLTVAASYTSAINMKYDEQLSVASTPFVNPMSDLTAAFGNELEQPAEVKAGIAYNMGNITLTGDFKQIRWSEAKGYKDFGWEDQNVISIGAKYKGNGYWVGAGYNKADNPIKAQNGATSYAGAVTNMFNNIFFPAVTEQHWSIGGGYKLTKNVAIDAAIVVAPQVTTTVDTSAVSSAFAGSSVSSSNTTKHSQQAYTVSVRYNF